MSPTRSAVVLLTLLALTAPAWAIERLPFDTISRAAVSGDDQKLIDEFTSQWGQALASAKADDPAMGSARDHLLDPLRQKYSPAFGTAYSTALSKHLTTALASDQSQVRINAMIVASQLTREVSDLVGTGLKDENPAVRYWAAKTAGQLGQAATLSADEEARVLASLSDALASEKSRLVAQQILLGMSALNIPQANAQLLTLLEARVTTLRANPTQSPAAEMRALLALMTRLTRATGAQTADQLRQAARVLYLYMHLSSQALLAEPTALEPSVRKDHEDNIVTAEKWLMWTYGKLGGSETLPGSVQNYIQQKRYNEVRMIVQDEWKKTMRRDPYNFSDDQLSGK
ncbi:MAG: HEAT repeat domain-containing protein [Phycisphaeraceae bacterium]